MVAPRLVRASDLLAPMNPLQGVMAALQSGQNAAINILGDSTSNAADEWGYQLGVKIGQALPDIRVVYQVWNDGAVEVSQTYDPLTVIQAGAQGDRYVSFASGRGRSLVNSEMDGPLTNLMVTMKLALDNWNTGADQVLAAHWGNSGSFSWRIRIDTLGRLVLTWSPDGTTSLVANSGSVLGFAPGEIKYLRVSLQVNNGAGGYAWIIQRSDDGATWFTINGATVAGTTAIFAGTTPWEIGALINTSDPIAGKIYSIEINDGYTGNHGRVINPQPVDAWRRYAAAYDADGYGGSPTLYIINGSKPGGGITYMTEAVRFKKLLKLYQPSLTIISTSHNEDMLYGKAWLTTLDGMLTMIKDRNPASSTAILVQNPKTGPGNMYQDHNKRLATIPFWAARNGVTVIDGSSCFIDAAGNVTASLLEPSDGVHPNTAGKAAQAALIASQFMPYIRLDRA